MKKVRVVYFIVCCLISVESFAQLSDLVRIEYTGLSDGSNDGATFNKYRALINYPIKLKKKDSYLVAGFDYKYVSFNADQDVIPFEADKLSEIKQFSISLGYTYKINKDWRFGAQIKPGYSTNLDVADITFDDAVISANIVFIKNKKEDEFVKKPYSLILGVAISGSGGFPVLPFISYYKKFHEKWSYNLGVPKTQLQYHLSDRSRLKLVTRIDGFSTNLQNGLITGSGTEKAERFRQRLLLGGLRYEFKFTKHIEYYVNGSYIIDNSLELSDGSRNTLFEFKEDNSFYLKTGVRFKI